MHSSKGFVIQLVIRIAAHGSSNSLQLVRLARRIPLLCRELYLGGVNEARDHRSTDSPTVMIVNQLLCFLLSYGIGICVANINI